MALLEWYTVTLPDGSRGKQCDVCGEVKPLDEIWAMSPPESRRGKYTFCIECHRKMGRGRPRVIKVVTCPDCGTRFEQVDPRSQAIYCPKCAGSRRSRIKTREDFWARVDKSSGVCWEWTGQRTPSGLAYGRLCWDGKPWQAHRLAYIFEYGSIPDGKIILHTCDNPPCVRPDHLTAGTYKDNALDRERKGRGGKSNHQRPFGEASARAKLTDATVLELRQKYAHRLPAPYAQLEREYGVTDNALRSAILGKTWRHVPMPPSPISD